LKTNGIDLQLHSSFDTDWGLFDLHTVVSHQLEYKVNAWFSGVVQDMAGFHLKPQTRAQATAAWARGNHGITLVANYIGPHSEWDGADLESRLLTTSSRDLDSWTTLDLAYRYDWGKRGRVRIGANNLANEDPVLDMDGRYSPGFNYLYNAIGAVYYLEYKLLID
jgi:iron complex outermembrane receptor protein